MLRSTQEKKKTPLEPRVPIFEPSDNHKKLLVEAVKADIGLTEAQPPYQVLQTAHP